MLIPKFSWLDNSALIIDGEYLNALREGMIVFYLMFPLRQFRDILWSYYRQLCNICRKSSRLLTKSRDIRQIALIASMISFARRYIRLEKASTSEPVDQSKPNLNDMPPDVIGKIMASISDNSNDWTNDILSVRASSHYLQSMTDKFAHVPFRGLRTKVNSLQVYEAAAYSASAEDSATTVKFFDAKLINV